MSGIPAGAGSLLGKRLGKYEILALLALGGTAEIYLARIAGAAGFEKYVVVKCLHDHLADDADFVRMFLDEARLAAHLDHSNVVQTMELGEHDNRYYMVMEFLAGLSLAMVVRRAAERIPGGKIPIPLILNMLAQASAGLHYAHEKLIHGKPLNIVHRDISPQNLVVSFEGVVKVVDFGIAKAELRETRTRSGTIKGKFAYMSPEQCVANNVDRRTDVFALGVIAHELMTGRRLFKKPSPYETYQAVIECKIAPPSQVNVEIDPALDPIIMRALCKDKEQRYATVEGFGDALLGYLHHRGKGSGPGDVARFFDGYFGQEIEEHSARMRELISGHDATLDSGVKWDVAQPDPRPTETVDLGGRDDGFDRPKTDSLSAIIDNLGTGRDDEADDLPAERTRIEANPLGRDEEPNQAITAQIPRPPQLIATQIAPIERRRGDLEGLKDWVASITPQPLSSDALPLPAPPTGSKPAVVSARFPAANLPTVVSDDFQPNLAKTEPEAMLGSNGPRARTSGVPYVRKPTLPHQSQLQPPRPTDPPQLDSEAPTSETSENVGLACTETSLSPRVMNVVSPVGPAYEVTVDWAAAAAKRAKAVPSWQLALLFVGALGAALLLTLVVAKLVLG